MEICSCNQSYRAFFFLFFYLDLCQQHSRVLQNFQDTDFTSVSNLNSNLDFYPDLSVEYCLSSMSDVKRDEKIQSLFN